MIIINNMSHPYPMIMNRANKRKIKTIPHLKSRRFNMVMSMDLAMVEARVTPVGPSS